MTSPTPSMSIERAQRRISIFVLAALSVLTLATSILLVTPEPAIDDFYIGYRYAYNWAAGHGVLYNVGEPPVEGYTSWTWIGLFTIAVKLGLDPLFFCQLVNSITAVATLPVLFALGKACGRSDYESLAAPTLLAVCITFIAYPMLGMTSSTFALMMALAVLVMARSDLGSPKEGIKLGVVLFILSMVRFDAVGLALGLLLYPVIIQRRIKPAVVPFLVVFVGLAIYNYWRYSYYGRPFPNTHYAKESPLAQDALFGLKYTMSFLTAQPTWIAAFPLALVAIWRGSTAARYAAWVCAGHLTYTIVVGGDWMPVYRFFLPVLPLYSLLIAEGLWRLRDELGGKSLSTAVASAAMSMFILMNIHAVGSSPWAGPEPASSNFWDNQDAFDIGDFLDEALDPDTVVATEWAGIIPARMRQPILDILGLNDKEIIMNDEFEASNQGRLITAEYLASRAPEIVIVVARIFPTVEIAAQGIANRPQDTKIAGLYRDLEKPGNDYELGVVKIREGGYWPCLFKPGSEWKARLCVEVPEDQTSRATPGAPVADPGIPG